MKLPLLLPVLATLALATPSRGQSPDERREEIHKLMERARQAKADGREDEANELMHQLKKLQGGAGRPDAAKEGAGPHNEKFARMKEEIGELHRSGKHEEAERLQHQLAEAASREHGAAAQRADGKGAEQLRHIMEAIGHLRAAGLNEPAENIEKIARHLREELERKSAAERAGQHEKSSSAGELNQLREQVERLSREMERLRDELKRQHSDGGKKE